MSSEQSKLAMQISQTTSTLQYAGALPVNYLDKGHGKFAIECGKFTMRQLVKLRKEAKALTFGQSARSNEGDTLLPQFAKLLMHLQKMENVRRERQLDADDLVELAEMVSIQYPHLTLSDAGFVIGKAMGGRYGKIIDGLNASMVGEWFAEHWENVMNGSAELEQESHAQHKQRPLGRHERSPLYNPKRVD